MPKYCSRKYRQHKLGRCKMDTEALPPSEKGTQAIQGWNGHGQDNRLKSIMSRQLRMFSNSIISPIYQGWGALCCGDFNLLLLTSVEDCLPVPDVTSSTGTTQMLGQFLILKRKHLKYSGCLHDFCLSLHPFIHPSIKTLLISVSLQSGLLPVLSFSKLVPSLFASVSVSCSPALSSVTDFHNCQNRAWPFQRSSSFWRESHNSLKT